MTGEKFWLPAVTVALAVALFGMGKQADDPGGQEITVSCDVQITPDENGCVAYIPATQDMENVVLLSAKRSVRKNLGVCVLNVHLVYRDKNQNQKTKQYWYGNSFLIRDEEKGKKAAAVKSVAVQKADGSYLAKTLVQ